MSSLYICRLYSALVFNSIEFFSQRCCLQLLLLVSPLHPPFACLLSKWFQLVFCLCFRLSRIISSCTILNGASAIGVQSSSRPSTKRAHSYTCFMHLHRARAYYKIHEHTHTQAAWNYECRIFIFLHIYAHAAMKRRVMPCDTGCTIQQL